MLDAAHRAGIKVAYTDRYVSFRRDSRELRIARRDEVYGQDMVAYFDTYHRTVEATDGLVDYSEPGLHRYTRSGLVFSLPALAEEDDAIEGYTHWYTPKAGDLVFDVGAHAGVSTYTLSQLVGPSGRVVAFEPDPIALPHLRRNVEAHGLANVTIVPEALAGARGRVAFQAEGSLGSAIVGAIDRGGTRDTVQVDALTLADACDRYGVPAFVKMDIEGAEIEVIGSSLELLRRWPIAFAIDTNHWRGGSLTSARVEALFAEAGYEVESSARYGFMTTWARPGAATPS